MGPFELVAADVTPRPVDKAALLRITRDLERGALASPPPLAIACLQDERFLTARTLGVYTRLAAAGTQVRLHARGLRSWLAPGVPGVALDDDDPLVDQWVLILRSDADPVAFAATDLHEPVDGDLERTFSYAQSRDPEVVTACARLLGADPPAPR